MRDVFTREPALVVAVLVAVLNLAVGLGYLSESTSQDFVTLGESVLVLAAGVLIRARVSPTDDTTRRG